MSKSIEELVSYRVARSKETLDEAIYLTERNPDFRFPNFTKLPDIDAAT